MLALPLTCQQMIGSWLPVKQFPYRSRRVRICATRVREDSSASASFAPLFILLLRATPSARSSSPMAADGHNQHPPTAITKVRSSASFLPRIVLKTVAVTMAGAVDWAVLLAVILLDWHGSWLPCFYYFCRCAELEVIARFRASCVQALVWLCVLGILCRWIHLWFGVVLLPCFVIIKSHNHQFPCLLEGIWILSNFGS